MAWSITKEKKRWGRYRKYVEHYEPLDMPWRMRNSYGWGYMAPDRKPYDRLLVKGTRARRAA